VVSIAVCASERSDIKYAGMLTPIYQNMNDLVMGLSLRRGPGVFLNVAMR
jgi:hypothetical protein